LPRCSKKNRHTPRKRSIQYAAPPRFHHWRLGILDRPLEPVIGRPFGRPVGGRCKFRSCPGRGAASFTLLRRAGPIVTVARWTPAQQRTAARCAASGERCGAVGGLSDESDEGNAERPHFARVPDAVQRPSRSGWGYVQGSHEPVARHAISETRAASPIDMIAVILPHFQKRLVESSIAQTAPAIGR
jgi:hypothetical protein